jgi:riboflavin biosynthesis protein ribF
MLEEGSSIALGNFDGVHLGHQQVISAAVKGAGVYTPAIYTFEINSKGAKCITSISDRSRLFYELGVKRCVFDDFKDVKDISAADFITDILIGRLNAKLVYCGEDFKFGKGAKGDTSLLKEYGDKLGFKVNIIPLMELDGKKISSSDIRRYIELGEIQKANRRLGRPYSITSDIIHGKGMGHTFGVPTINQCFNPCMVEPKFGVYATRISLGGKIYNSITNIGVRPSVNDGKNPNIETFVFDYNNDVYGLTTTVYFYKMIREERKFKSLDLLYNTIQADINTAKLFFAQNYGEKDV